MFPYCLISLIQGYVFQIKGVDFNPEDDFFVGVNQPPNPMKYSSGLTMQLMKMSPIPQTLS